MKPLAVAVEAALAGGRILRSFYHGFHSFHGSLRVSYKGEVDLVTEADLASERAVVSILSQRFPRASILAEEGGERPGAGDRIRFVVDPLDGTTNFAHGYPTFAVSIGYEEEGRVVAGCVYDPIREELFTAEKGRGAFLNGRRLEVSKTARLDGALLVTGFPYDFKADLEKSARLFLRFMAESRAVRRDGSAALDLCYLAAGRIDGFWEEKLSPWDTAAGAFLVEEAGGSVTNFRGAPFHCSQPSVVASNGRLHQQMLAVVA
jgi:myo-inositol-1(or 4)-monophosphatase